MMNPDNASITEIADRIQMIDSGREALIDLRKNALDELPAEEAKNVADRVTAMLDEYHSLYKAMEERLRTRGTEAMDRLLSENPDTASDRFQNLYGFSCRILPNPFTAFGLSAGSEMTSYLFEFPGTSLSVRIEK